MAGPSRHAVHADCEPRRAVAGTTIANDPHQHWRSPGRPLRTFHSYFPPLYRRRRDVLPSQTGRRTGVASRADVNYAGRAVPTQPRICRTAYVDAPGRISGADACDYLYSGHSAFLPDLPRTLAVAETLSEVGVVGLPAIFALQDAARHSEGSSDGVSMGASLARAIYSLHSQLHKRLVGGLYSGSHRRDGAQLPRGGRGVAAQVARGDGRERPGVSQLVLDPVRLFDRTQQRLPGAVAVDGL